MSYAVCNAVVELADTKREDSRGAKPFAVFPLKSCDCHLLNYLCSDQRWKHRNWKCHAGFKVRRSCLLQLLSSTDPTPLPSSHWHYFSDRFDLENSSLACPKVNSPAGSICNFNSVVFLFCIITTAGWLKLGYIYVWSAATLSKCIVKLKIEHKDNMGHDVEGAQFCYCLFTSCHLCAACDSNLMSPLLSRNHHEPAAS